MNKFIDNINIKQYLIIGISLIIPFLVYAAILMIDLPSNMADLIRHEVSWLLVVFAGLLYISYSVKGWLGISLSLTTTLALFALPLARLWSTGVSQIFAWGGILTWTDSAGYYIHAGNILQGLSMTSSIHHARPFFVGILCFLFWLTHLNLQITLSILTALIGISCFFLAREVQKSYGTSAGILVILCLFLFIRPLIGSVMTENLGLCLGTLSLALLLRGARKMSLNMSLMGLFILTIALNVRTGAFFVLPFILLWGCYVFRGSKLISNKFFLGGISLILLGFILNSLLLKAIAAEDGSSSYGNFAFMFYGVITKSDWLQIFRDYPELGKMSSNQLIEEKSYEILWTTIMNNPINSIQGIINEWRKLFFEENYSIFFIERINKLELGLRLIAFMGLIKCLFDWKKPINSLIILYGIGVFLSVPFLAGSFRTYAATIVIVPLFSAIGLSTILEKICVFLSQYGLKFMKNIKKTYPINLKIPNILKDNFYKKPDQSVSWQNNILPIFSLSLVIISFISPIIIKNTVKTPTFSNISCPSGLETVYFRNNPGSSINLVNDKNIINSHFPNIRLTDFREGLNNLQWMKQEISKLSQIDSELTLFNIYDWTWLVAKSAEIPKKPQWMLACGKTETTGEIRLFYADYLKAISSQINSDSK